VFIKRQLTRLWFEIIPKIKRLTIFPAVFLCSCHWRQRPPVCLSNNKIIVIPLWTGGLVKLPKRSCGWISALWQELLRRSLGPTGYLLSQSRSKCWDSASLKRIVLKLQTTHFISSVWIFISDVKIYQGNPPCLCLLLWSVDLVIVWNLLTKFMIHINFNGLN